MTEPNDSHEGAASSAPVDIPEDDAVLLSQCRVETFRAGGPGGQHQNTTESGVRLVHLPTGERAEARDERSQYRNRRLALQRLRARLEALNKQPAERIPTQVPRSQKRKRLENKKRRSRKKKLRKPPGVDE